MRSVQRSYPFIVTIIFVILITQLRARSWDQDEFEHMQFAWSLWKGAIPYKEVFENHPPLYYLAVQPFFWVFGGSDHSLACFIPISLRALSLVFTAISTFLTAMIVRRCGGSVFAAWIATLLMLGDSFLLAKGIEIRPDTLALVALLATTYCVLAGLQSEPRKLSSWTGLAGMAGAVALLSTPKPLFGLIGLALAFLINVSGKVPRAVILKAIIFALLGALLVAVPVMAWLAAVGGLHDFVVWNINLVGHLPRFPEYVAKFLKRAMERDSVLIIVALAGTISLVRQWSCKRGEDFSLVIVLPLLCLAVGVIAIPNLELQYLLLMVPFCAIAGSLVLAPLLEQARPEALGTLTSIMMVILIGWILSNLVLQWQERDTYALQKLKFVLAHSDPDASVLWGWDAGVAFRKPAFFYILNENFRKIPSDADYQALADGIHFGTIRPSLIAFDDEILLLPAPVLSAIRTAYTPVGKYNLWRRKDGQGFIAGPSSDLAVH